MNRSSRTKSYGEFYFDLIDEATANELLLTISYRSINICNNNITNFCQEASNFINCFAMRITYVCFLLNVDINREERSLTKPFMQ